VVAHCAATRNQTLRQTATSLRLQDTPAAASLAEDVYQILKWKILTRKVQPGTLLTEEELCTLVGYGRTPVHQALHRLKYDGLVEILPRKGIVVRTFSLEGMADLIEARLPLEMEVARLAARRAKPKQVRELRSLLARGGELLKRGDLEGLMTIDRQFHHGLAACAANPVLGELLEILHQRSLILWHVSVPVRGPQYEAVHGEHQAVLDCIAVGDAEGAALRMRQHLERFLSRPD